MSINSRAITRLSFHWRCYQCFAGQKVFPEYCGFAQIHASLHALMCVVFVGFRHCSDAGSSWQAASTFHVMWLGQVFSRPPPLSRRDCPVHLGSLAQLAVRCCASPQGVLTHCVPCVTGRRWYLCVCSMTKTLFVTRTFPRTYEVGRYSSKIRNHCETNNVIPVNSLSECFVARAT